MIELLTMGWALTPEYEAPDYIQWTSMSAYIELYYPEWYNDSYVESNESEWSEVLEDSSGFLESEITNVFNNIDE